MTTVDALRFATHALGQHRRRSILSLVGVAIGIIAVVTLTALGEGARRYVTDQFASLGHGLLIVMPGRTETTGAFPHPGGTPNDLTLDDARVLEREIPSVLRMVPITLGSGEVSYRDRSRQVMIVGSTSDFRIVRDLQVTRGRFLPPGDVERGAPVVAIGRKVAQELFDEQDPVGRSMRVGDWRMRVIGVLAARGTQMGLDLDETVIVPVATGLRMTNRESLSRVVLQLRPQADVEAAKRHVVDIIVDRHDENDVTCITQEAVLESLSSILGALTLVVAGIAAISLTVAGIGIMNVMLVSVSERTAEVGLLKALGATRRQILAVFLLEAVLLSVAGGSIGLTIGWLATQVVMIFYPSFPVTPPLWAVLSVVGVSFATGSLFGVLPAWRAARLDPISALAGH